eukprot:TRINITY_DN13807_c0_g2_i1.p1 TRINITY_DN13807_c0_g2~~TRINITY_DN13807_c0_g2_i1.p1  ORF type:complete len:192 (+),score=51.96 TRINITY_DN13807_c0_g2_i1:99-674(+)
MGVDQRFKSDCEMRTLTDDETKAVFEKLAKFIGTNIKFLIDREDEPHVFRLIKSRVFYMSETQMKLASNFGADTIISVGICVGKFTKTGKFRLGVSAIELIAKFAKAKVWVKHGGEQSFVYGNHIVKAHIGRMTENVGQYEGVVVMTMDDIPLGFGITAKASFDIPNLEPTGLAILNQADAGEYLRTEDAD